jgi:hypothetical protein
LIHFYGALTLPTGTDWHSISMSVGYGDELTVTAPIVAASLDRNGRSWLDLLDDEPAQIRRWGRVMMRRGPWPLESRIEPGSAQWLDARDAARAEAHKIENPADRERALLRVRQQFGDAPTSRTLASYRSAR